jgi:hypothetical protein
MMHELLCTLFISCAISSNRRTSILYHARIVHSRSGQHGSFGRKEVQFFSFLSDRRFVYVYLRNTSATVSSSYTLSARFCLSCFFYSVGRDRRDERKNSRRQCRPYKMCDIIRSNSSISLLTSTASPRALWLLIV